MFMPGYRRGKEFSEGTSDERSGEMNVRRGVVLSGGKETVGDVVEM